MAVSLFKKTGKYTDKQGQEKSFTNFYVRCGDMLIPVQVCFFPDEQNKDPQYSSRKAVLSAFAEILPEKQKSTEEHEEKVKVHLQPVEDVDSDDIPF